MAPGKWGGQWLWSTPLFFILAVVGNRTATFQALKWHALPEQRKAEWRSNLMTALKFSIWEELTKQTIIFVRVVQVWVNLILSVHNYRWKISICHDICSFLSKKTPSNIRKILLKASHSCPCGIRSISALRYPHNQNGLSSATHHPREVNSFLSSDRNTASHLREYLSK